MAAKTVDQFMAELEHPLKAEIEALRAIVLRATGGITEQIKWNAPSFCYGGDDRVTFKLHPPDRVQIIFHRGARVKDASGFTFTDDTGLLEWLAKDRAIATFRSMADVEANRAALAGLVAAWMQATA